MAQSLHLKFTHITSEDGLPHSTVHGIAKDKYGFMWFGTWSGLCRYDGYTFHVYHYDPDNSRSIINNRIHNIIRDEHGDLWILTFDNQYVCRYSYETDDFDRIPLEELPPVLKSSLSRRNHIQNVNFTYKDFNWKLDHYNNSIVETYLPTGDTHLYLPNLGNPWSINDTYVTDIYLDDQQMLWLGTYSNGINKTYLNANPFYYWLHDPNTRNSIIENSIRSIGEDNDGNIWVGTRSKGITIVSPTGHYRQLQHEGNDIYSISSNYIKKIFCDSKGMVWIGNQKGVDRYDPRTKQIKRLTISGLDNTTVFDIIEDQNHDIWLASWNGIVKYDRSDNTFIHFDPAETLPTRYIWKIFKDSEQRIWVGTEGEGVVVLKETKAGGLDIITHLKHDSSKNNTISDNRIYAIFEDRSKQLWIGTGNGLDRFDPKTHTFTHFSDTQQQFPQGTVSGITEDNGGNIWVSHKRGLSRINPQTFAFRNFTQQDGLQSSEFADGAVFRSKRKNELYFAGNNGVNFFCPDSIKIDTTPPRLVLTELQVLNRSVRIDSFINGRILLKKPLYLTESLHLIHDDKSFAISFSALHYTNPQGNKYAYMLEGFDKDWIYTDASQRIATYSNLSPGDYVFKVRASNSDGIWTTTPTMLRIHVAPPWWASGWAYLCYTLIFLTALLLSYYYLVRYAKLKNKLAYEELLNQKERELHESKIRFFTNISHEIKTPLTLILSPIQQLTQQASDHPALQHHFVTMKRNGDRLLKIVNQLLDIRRMESGYERLQLTQQDIVQHTVDIVEHFNDLAQSKNITLQVIASQKPFIMYFDMDKIEKVMNNLLSNALKFTPAGGMVTVQLYATESTFTIAVSDTGIGIALDDLGAIFEPFKQSTINNPSGSGLGLSYAKSLVELHGGMISVASERRAGGNQTTFTVQLPIRLTDVASTTIVESTPTDSGISFDDSPTGDPSGSEITLDILSEKPTILLVEDNTELRAHLRTYFIQYYHILEAGNGQEALDIVHTHMPDLIISDVMMPQMDGVTFCAKIKSDLATGHIPVILLTARSLPEYEMEGLKTGADDYLVKPFNLDVLALKVKNQLLNRIRLQERFRLKVAVAPTEIDVESPDEKLLQKVLQYVEDNISNSDLKIDTVCNSIGLSRGQLYRKMKALTGYTLADLIREIRLKRAQQLLRDKKHHINEIAYMVGFTDADYFRKCFKTKFGLSPTEYAKKYNGKE